MLLMYYDCVCEAIKQGEIFTDLNLVRGKKN